MTQGKCFAMKAAGAGRDVHALRLEQRFIRALENRAEAADSRPQRCTGCGGMKPLTGEAMLRAHREATIGRLA